MLVDTENCTARSADAKLHMLSHGTSYDAKFLRTYDGMAGAIEKRRAYGNSDGFQFPKSTKVPPEVELPGGIIASVNYCADSPVTLSIQDGQPQISIGEESLSVCFTPRPQFYDARLPTGRRVAEIATVYGKRTLVLFTPGHCQYFSTGDECRFCSLRTTRQTQSDHRMNITPAEAAAAVAIALREPDMQFSHVLLNGGTLTDYDEGFRKHLDLLSEIRMSGLPENVELHVITMPPRDHTLLARLADLNVTIAMSIEVFDEGVFAELCPGKSGSYGRSRFLDAFDETVDVLGNGRVYAGFVAGLEPASRLIDGMHYFGERGIVPAVNVFHFDPGTALERHPRPTVD
ncbi:MAG: radical SAM protein [Planctomycetaceae bacterium]|nr:radical SAM protein [Planctomycetaceae bacterium]